MVRLIRRKKPLIYFAHPMEGLKIPEESGLRALEARKLLGEEYEVWIPEEHQVAVEEQQDMDLSTLIKADIVIADFYAMGLERHGEPVYGKGTNQEVGYMKCANHLRYKQVPIIQVVRQSKNFHCFDMEGLVTKNCTSLEEACKYVKRQYPVKTRKKK